MFRPLALTLWLCSLIGVRAQTDAAGRTPGVDSDPVQVTAGDPRVAPITLERVRAIAHKGLSQLAPTFPGTPLRRVHLVVHADVNSLSASQREHLHAGTAGFALLGRDEVHLLLDEAVSEPPNDLRTVVVHELVHVLLDQYVGAGAPFVPRWVHEGLAQHLSGGAYLGVQEESLMFAITARTAPRFSQLVADFPERDDLLRLAYAQSYSFIDYLIDRFGVRTVVDAARDARADHPFGISMLDSVDQSLARLQDDWENYVLFRSGAAARFFLRNCFSFLTVLAVPLLIIVALKRMRLNRLRKEQLAQADPSPLIQGPGIQGPGEGDAP